MTSFQQIQLGDGSHAFRKFLSSGESDIFLAEAYGLRALAATATVRTPSVLRVSTRELVTAWVGGGSESSMAWRVLGESLAAMHALPQQDFGFESDNYCGATPQANRPGLDGWDFFAEQRLLYQGRLARDTALLSAREMDALESIAGRLRGLLPAQEPALLHGDLWRGNVVFSEAGAAFLVDPAAHRGWPEAELAMTTLFGEFDGKFYAAYEERGSIAADWRSRTALYNLYHLLNHLNLFGGGYYGQVTAILKRYA